MNNDLLVCLSIPACLQHAWTALMWGTNKDNLEMVELLLANNADPNVRDKVYSTRSSRSTAYL
jgi:ankyrin repeat protein